MFASALEVTETTAAPHVNFLGNLLLLNLADQFGSFGFFDKGDEMPAGIPYSTLDACLDVWKKLSDVLMETQGDAQHTRQLLMQLAQREASVVARITSLLNSAGIECDKYQVQQTLKSVCLNKFVLFCRLFGVVRLSYALRFFRELAKKAREEGLDSDRARSLVVDILFRIVNTYEGLIRAQEGQGRETGIEMAWLKRSNEVCSSIVSSLVGGAEVHDWIADEISAFPCS